MDPKIQKIIQKVAKLLALAGNNSNENEAAAAIEKAYAILAEHNMSLTEVQAHGAKVDASEGREKMANESNFSETYYGFIWQAVAELNFCVVYHCRPNPKKRQTFYTLIGRSVNVLVASQMATYLCQTVRRLANTAAKEEGRKDNAFKNAFIAGCCARLATRVRAMKATVPTGTENALVLWSGAEEAANFAYMEALGIKTKERQAVSRSLDRCGYSAGEKAADEVSLDQQVSGAEPRATLG